MWSRWGLAMNRSRSRWRAIMLGQRRTDGQRHPTRRRVALVERLEDRLVLSGLVNGDFSISNPSDPNYGWTTKGNAVDRKWGRDSQRRDDGADRVFPELHDRAGDDDAPVHDRGFNLLSNGAASPPDAFEAALLELADQSAAGRAGDRALEHGRVPEHPADRRGLLCTAGDGAWSRGVGIGDRRSRSRSRSASTCRACRRTPRPRCSST